MNYYELNSDNNMEVCESGDWVKRQEIDRLFKFIDEDTTLINALKYENKELKGALGTLSNHIKGFRGQER